jgi:serine/threonine-protein phosphatase 6 regulatory ankyrin repeat subunit A/serine/threonine-protein phosphatase 6 regulatory ankyrin repeat subunit B
MDAYEHADSLIWDDDTAQLADVLSAHPDLLAARDPDGICLLHRASSLGSTRATALLLGLGASPFVRDHRGNTPLHYAAMATTYQSGVGPAHLLVLHGAQIDRRSSYWETPLMVSAQYSNLDVFSYLIAAGARVDYRNRRGQNVRDIAAYQLEGVPTRKAFQQQRGDLQSMVDLLDSSLVNR